MSSNFNLNNERKIDTNKFGFINTSNKDNKESK